MALPHKSIAIESGIEFVNLEPIDINPLMSKCEIKVFYLGKNRNRSFINKEVATEMAKTLRGCPIVGYFKEQKEDFADHGEQVILDDEGIHFNVLTKPYGFVAPDSKVWFRDYEEEDAFGNTIIRTYLCTEGYIWTGQFEEAKKVLEDEGKPHSMELDKNSVQGTWSEDFKDNIEFFIISDAIFSKLCILGDDVEPCYEGSAITEPTVDTKFTMNQEFKDTLFNMMKELQFVLKGDSQMPEEKIDGAVVQEEQNVQPAAEENFSAEQDNSVQTAITENQNNIEGQESAPAETEFKKEEEKKDEEKETEKKEESGSEEEKEDEEDKKKPTKSTLEQNYEELQNNFAKIQKEYEDLKTQFDSLVEFKNSVENQKKDELIAKFYMLSDEDKKEVIENKSKYSYEQIEEKLAVIGFKKGVNFSIEQDTPNNNQAQEDASITFNLEGINAENASLPEWVQAVKDTEKTQF